MQELTLYIQFEVAVGNKSRQLRRGNQLRLRLPERGWLSSAGIRELGEGNEKEMIYLNLRDSLEEVLLIQCLFREL